MNSKNIVKLESIKVQIDRLKGEVQDIARDCGLNLSSKYGSSLEIGTLKTLFDNLSKAQSQLDIDIQNLVMEKSLQENNND